MEVEFLAEVGDVGAADFENALDRAMRGQSVDMGWGTVRAIELRRESAIDATRVFSPYRT